jgi:hypothetical protein
LANPQHFKPNEMVRQVDRVSPVHANRIESLQPRQRTAIGRYESASTADVRNRPAGFNAAENVPDCQMLMFERHRRLAKDPSLVQRIQHRAWK